MKKTLRVISLVAVATLSVMLLVIFFSVLFSRSGDAVYVIAVDGDVKISSISDLSLSETACSGMKLSSGNIILTGERSSCVLSYDENIDNKSNFISVNSGTQLRVGDKNAQGGYDFYVVDGSVICNMPVSDGLKTNISSRFYNFFVEETIAKADYDAQNETGKVFVFDGNPYVQIVQPSGSGGKVEKLLKNSVCAVRSMDDGSVGFGCLNTGFGLNEFSAQDLKTMSGIANVWSERISYSTGEFERAFQTASDYTDYTTATVVTSGSSTDPVDIFIESSVTSDHTGTSESVELADSEETIESFDESTYEPNYDDLPVYTEFTRPTLVELKKDEPEQTTVTSTSQVTSAATTVRTTAAVTQTTTIKPIVTTVTTTSLATSKPSTTTTAVKVDPDATHTVIFTYNENGNNYWAIQLVKHGQAAIAPDVPDIEGKYFVKWDCDFSHVTSDMTVNGIFAEGQKPVENHVVKFYVNSELWKTVSVKDGGSIKLDDVPKSDGRKFIGWSDDLVNVISDMTVFALFSD